MDELETGFDLGSLFSVIGEPSPQGDAGSTPPDVTPQQPEEVIAEPHVGQEPIVDEPAIEEPVENTEQPEVTLTPEQEASNRAFAKFRAENTAYTKLMDKMMRAANYTGTREQFMAALEETTYVQQAKTHGQGVDPQILKRIDNAEQINKELLEERNRNTFYTNLSNLGNSLGLSQADMREFIDVAVKNKIDLTIPGTNFVTLYQGLMYDKLKEREIENARQEWIKQSQKADNATNPSTQSGKKTEPGQEKEISSVAELDRLFKSI